MNELLIRRMRDNKYVRHRSEPIMSHNEHPDPYMEAGSHPDVVGHVWDRLGASLPVDCRAIVYGTPALVHPEVGIVFAMAFGTRYVVRVPSERLEAAFAAGCHTEQEWTGGKKTDLSAEMGNDWVFGSGAKDEQLWLEEMYQVLGDSA